MGVGSSRPNTLADMQKDIDNLNIEMIKVHTSDIMQDLIKTIHKFGLNSDSMLYEALKRTNSFSPIEMCFFVDDIYPNFKGSPVTKIVLHNEYEYEKIKLHLIAIITMLKKILLHRMALVKELDAIVKSLKKGGRRAAKRES